MEIDSVVEEPGAGSFGFSHPRQSKWFAASVLAGLTVVFLASVIFKPATGEYFTVCGFKNFTGLPCPGCGLTHSFCALGKGDVLDAFGFNLIGPPLFLVFVFVWVRAASVLLNKQSIVDRIDQLASRVNLVRIFALAFAVYGVARIVYLVTFQPLSLHDSPLSKLLAGLVH